MKDTSFREYRELGEITWLRDFEVGQGEAKTSGKPIVLLFQEVPGCSTCVTFGQDVLSHPLLVELIEECFVPVAIFNNRPGKDAAVLRAFSEPAWNNPVVYLLDAEGTPIVPKLSNRYDPLGLYDRLVGALVARGKEIPPYAQLLRSDLMIENGLAQQAIYETPCFWSGETTLAGFNAVLSTEAGWIGGEEVVRVNFDPALADAEALDRFAIGEGFRRGKGRGFCADDAPQYYLSKSRLAELPVSLSQRTRINLAIPYKDAPEQYLSPRQRRWLEGQRKGSLGNRKLYKQDFRQAWASFTDEPSPG